jgi:CheY-like chemotaxis protein
MSKLSHHAAWHEAGSNGRHLVAPASIQHHDPMKILIADGNHILADVLAEHLRVRGHEVTTTYDGRVACACCRRQRFDAIVIDLLMPDIHGIEVLEQLYADCRMPRAILTSGFPELLDEIAPRLTGIGVQVVLQKPFQFTELDKALTRLGTSNLGPSNIPDQNTVETPMLDIGLPPLGQRTAGSLV